MNMEYERERKLFLDISRLGNSPDDIKAKYCGFTRIAERLRSSLEVIWAHISSDYEMLSHSSYIISEFEKNVSRTIVQDVFDSAFEDEEHTNYKNFLVYLADSQEMTLARESKWKELGQTIIAKYREKKRIIVNSALKETIREYDPDWEYSMHGSYGLYRELKDKPEFRIMMSLLGREFDKETTLDLFEKLLLLKEVELQLRGTADLMQTLGLAAYAEGRIPSSPKAYKLNYEMLQEIHGCLDRYGTHISYDDFLECVINADFSNIGGKQNPIKCSLTYFSKAIKGGGVIQGEWYGAAAKSMGVSKSESRKGANNMPEGLDDELKRVVSRFEAKSKVE